MKLNAPNNETLTTYARDINYIKNTLFSGLAAFH